MAPHPPFLTFSIFAPALTFPRVKDLACEDKERRCREMALQQGEVYRCPDAACGCEITVTKGAAEGHGGDKNPTCCCGHSMEKVG
jgi:hypothetical protein